MDPERHRRCHVGREMIAASLRARARYTTPIVVVGICQTFAFVAALLYYGHIRYGIGGLLAAALVGAAALLAAYFHNRNLRAARWLGEGKCLVCGYQLECPVCCRCPECGHAESWAR